MTSHRYKMPNGNIVDVSYIVDPTLHPEFEYLGVTPEKEYEEPGYDWKRKRAYPSISDQLDALWHAMHNGTLPKAEPFYSEIKAVKDRFPKPSN
jgi:hypothetical protein